MTHLILRPLSDSSKGGLISGTALNIKHYTEKLTHNSVFEI